MLGSSSAALAVRRVRVALAGCVVVVATAVALAQEPPLAFPPAAADIRVFENVEYISGAEPLRMDVYRPAASGTHPVLIFFIRAQGPDRHQPVYDAWARAAAGRGLVAILPDIRAGHEVEDLDHLHDYLSAHARELALEADNVAVYSASGNVSTGFPVVEDASRTWISAAVMYYGSAQFASFRRDLPVLWVRAGLDRPAVNASIIALAERALRENIPLTLVNQQTGHHGFDLLDRDAATRGTVEQTLDFVVRATRRDYQAALRALAVEAAAAAHVASGRFHDAAAAYRALVDARPDDARMRLAYGEALLGDHQYAAACGEFDKLRDADLGARDRGLPAAEACLKKGDAEAAIGWLKSIPPQFRPASIQGDPAFAALRERAEFKALFER
jgi:dienelactone hydrolase